MADAFEPPGFAHGDLVAVVLRDGTLRTELAGKANNPDPLRRMHRMIGAILEFPAVSEAMADYDWPTTKYRTWLPGDDTPSVT